MIDLLKCLPVFLISLFLISCGGGGGSSPSPTTPPISTPQYSLSATFSRVDQAGLSPFKVTVSLQKDGANFPGQTVSLNIPKGNVSSVTDHNDGTYSFTVTPSSTGVYPVTISYAGTNITRAAIVLDGEGAGVGQPIAVPGDYVNTAGYEDGAAITSDGQYLFVQYSPAYFSGILYLTTICADSNYSLMNVNNCGGKPNSDWVFKSIGPYNNNIRPGFPSNRITSTGVISHLESIVVPNVANGIALFPTAFYGFKRQTDGSFAQPFIVAFDDQGKGSQSPFGISLQLTSSNTANFVVAWDNYVNNLGDDKPDIYAGSLTLGQNTNLGSVIYDGDVMSSATPNITPVNFTSHLGTQGNPHLYADSNNVVRSIWTDDETTTKDLTVYTLASGNYPNGTWAKVNLPAKINTSADESQPFFNGSKLYLRRGNKIVSHTYLGSDGNNYDVDSSWGDEVIVLESKFNTNLNEIIALGEPTIGTINGKSYLYFVYGSVRAAGENNLNDINMDVGFVELP